MNKMKDINLTALSIAYRAILHQKRRACLTILAISIGIASAIVIMAAGKGMQRLVLSQLDAFGPDTLYIETHVPHQKSNDSGIGSVGITITTLKERDIETVREHPNIVAAYGQVIGQEAVRYEGNVTKTMILGKGADTVEVEKFSLSEGRFFTHEEESSLNSVVVLGATTKEKLFGDDIAIEKTIAIRGKPFRVVGVMAKRGSAFFLDQDNVITIPTKTMQKKLLGIDYVQAISAKMQNTNNSKQTVEDLTEGIRKNHHIETTETSRDDFIIQTMADAQLTLTTITDGITFLLIALVGISLLVGGVGIMNIMYVSVVERTFEIGLRKALGAKKNDILWQFLLEALLITSSGGIVGIILGASIAFIIYLIANALNLLWIYSIPPLAIVLAVSFSACIGLIFGYFPARQAAHKNPIEALRFE